MDNSLQIQTMKGESYLGTGWVMKVDEVVRMAVNL
jgi:hypothetical protein